MTDVIANRANTTPFKRLSSTISHVFRQLLHCHQGHTLWVSHCQTEALQSRHASDFKPSAACADVYKLIAMYSWESKNKILNVLIAWLNTDGHQKLNGTATSFGTWNNSFILKRQSQIIYYTIYLMVYFAVSRLLHSTQLIFGWSSVCTFRINDYIDVLLRNINFVVCTWGDTAKYNRQ